MAYKEPVIKAKVHSANQAVSNEDYQSISNPAQATAIANATIKNIEKKQEEIDYYNSTTVHKIDPAFKDLVLAGKSVIVRLHKENYIKSVSYYADEKPLYDAWFSQVDGRMHASQPAKWVDTPLPYVFSGVVVAISPAAELANKQDSQEAEKNGIYAPELKVGDIVYLEHFNFAEKRFYLDKQQRDFIKNPEEFRIVHFEGYVKIHPTMIEGVVTDKNNFVYNTSPYLRHKMYMASKVVEVDENEIPKAE